MGPEDSRDLSREQELTLVFNTVKPTLGDVLVRDKTATLVPSVIDIVVVRRRCQSELPSLLRPHPSPSERSMQCSRLDLFHGHVCRSRTRARGTMIPLRTTPNGW